MALPRTPLLHFNEIFIGTANKEADWILTHAKMYLKLYFEVCLWAEPYSVNFWHCYANISFEYTIRFQGWYLSYALISLFLLAVVTLVLLMLIMLILILLMLINILNINIQNFRSGHSRPWGSCQRWTVIAIKTRCSHDGIFLWKWSVHDTVYIGYKSFGKLFPFSCLPTPITHLSKALI